MDTPVEKVAIMVLSGCATSQVCCLFKECDGDARPCQITGGAQTGHPATNDNNICLREIRFHFCLHFYLIIQVNDLSHKQDRKELAFVTHEDKGYGKDSFVRYDVACLE